MVKNDIPKGGGATGFSSLEFTFSGGRVEYSIHQWIIGTVWGGQRYRQGQSIEVKTERILNQRKKDSYHMGLSLLANTNNTFDSLA